VSGCVSEGHRDYMRGADMFQRVHAHRPVRLETTPRCVRVRVSVCVRVRVSVCVSVMCVC